MTDMLVALAVAAGAGACRTLPDKSSDNIAPGGSLFVAPDQQFWLVLGDFLPHGFAHCTEQALGNISVYGCQGRPMRNGPEVRSWPDEAIERR